MPLVNLTLASPASSTFYDKKWRQRGWLCRYCPFNSLQREITSYQEIAWYIIRDASSIDLELKSECKCFCSNSNSKENWTKPRFKNNVHKTTPLLKWYIWQERWRRGNWMNAEKWSWWSWFSRCWTSIMCRAQSLVSLSCRTEIPPGLTSCSKHRCWNSLHPPNPGKQTVRRLKPTWPDWG